MGREPFGCTASHFFCKSPLQIHKHPRLDFRKCIFLVFVSECLSLPRFEILERVSRIDLLAKTSPVLVPDAAVRTNGRAKYAAIAHQSRQDILQRVPLGRAVPISELDFVIIQHPVIHGH